MNEGDTPDSTAVREITLSGRDLSDAARLLSLLAHDTPSERLSLSSQKEVRSSPKLFSIDRMSLRGYASKILALRGRRGSLLSPSMFGEPAWEMLLVLYVSDGARFTTRQLVERTGLPHSTGLRWVEYLAQQGFMSREAHPTDLRAMRVELTERARTALDMFVSETLNALS